MRACGRARRTYRVKDLIAWPKASSLAGLFPACIVTRTASIKACARYRRRGDRVTDRAFISRDSSTLPMLRFGVALKSRSKGVLWVMNDRFVMFARCPLRPDSDRIAAFTATDARARPANWGVILFSTLRRRDPLRRGSNDNPCRTAEIHIRTQWGSRRVAARGAWGRYAGRRRIYDYLSPGSRPVICRESSTPSRGGRAYAMPRHRRYGKNRKCAG